MSAPVDDACILVDGPWTHRFVNANGSRFHVVEAGTGPLVLLLHGFPEFWWAWHEILPTIADTGFRAVAVDLRGYGASDKPPRGYDGYTLAADIAGLVRALGERTAVLAGSGVGGMIGWTVASLYPELVHRLVVLSAAHPLRLRTALLADPRGQARAAAPTLRFQLPRYEHVLTRDNAAVIGDLLRRWGGAPWVAGDSFEGYAQRCRDAMRIPQAAFCALETYRWAFRSMLRLRGYRFVRQLQRPLVTPTLQLHGALDAAVLPRTAQGSGRYVIAGYEWRLLAGVGHFPHVETPDLVAGEILRWAKS